MRQLSGELLLTAFDYGVEDNYLGRILTMLTIAQPEVTREKIAALSLKEITLQLLALHATNFGPQLEGSLACPSCSARLEFSMPIAPVIERLHQSASSANAFSAIGGTGFTMRLATPSDLLSIEDITDVAKARKHLLARCLGEMQGATLDSALNDPEFCQLAVETFDQLQSDAEINVELVCAECNKSHLVDLDLGRFLWAEIRSAAMRLMRDVHDLASAYGWQESAILAMSGIRRQTYLEMIQ